ncbi:MAG: hypothetical protein LC749_03140 [Actinobacteria bacterium]|nr:hypothetical protein [Actinomycetota bacterium]
MSRNRPAAAPPAVHDLIQAIKDLDNHLCEGGAPPDDWNRASLRASTTRAHQFHPVENITTRRM